MSTDSRYLALLRALPDLILVLDGDGVFLGSTGRSEDSLAVSPSDFLGKNILDVFPGDFGTMGLGVIRRALETGELQSFEYQLPVPLGSDYVRDFEARAIAASDDEVVVVVRDITERKAAEESAAAERESSARVEMLNHISLALSHHLRNAITPIIGFAAAWRPSDPEGEALKKAIREQGKRITAVIQVIEQMADRGDTATHDILGPGTPEMLDLRSGVADLLDDWRDNDILRWPEAS